MSDDVSAILASIRRARFSAGFTCIHCRGTRLHRHGYQNGRQRYRCLSCRRTFSDLTLTAAAYSKRLQQWPGAAACMAASMTVRATARELEISPGTAFRWRHILLQETQASDRSVLRGLVELTSTQLAHSRKGDRQLDRPARDHGVFDRPGFWFLHRLVTIGVASDRNAEVATHIVDGSQIQVGDLVAGFTPRLENVQLLIAQGGEFSAPARFARSLGVAYCDVHFARNRTEQRNLENTRGYVRRFHSWLRIFRGVATRYLGNYLAWRRLVDLMSPQDVARTLLEWRCAPDRLARA